MIAEIATKLRRLVPTVQRHRRIDDIEAAAEVVDAAIVALVEDASEENLRTLNGAWVSANRLYLSVTAPREPVASEQPWDDGPPPMTA